jgi:hypothetical protein
MLKIWDANNFRRTLAGLCLITAPLALGAADLIRMSVEGDAQGTRAQFDLIAASPGAWQVATVLNMLGIVLFVPAVLGLLHLLHHRGAVLGHIGGGLLLIGLLGFAAHNAGYYGTLGAVSAPGIDQEQMIRFWQASETVPGNLVWLLMFLIGYVLGMVLLGVGPLLGAGRSSLDGGPDRLVRGRVRVCRGEPAHRAHLLDASLRWARYDRLYASAPVGCGLGETRRSRRRRVGHPTGVTRRPPTRLRNTAESGLAGVSTVRL